MRNWLVLALAGLFSAPAWADTLPTDPTRPPAARPAVPAAQAVPAPLQLSSTLLGGQRPVAIINGRSYTVGDAVNGLRIRAVGPGWVRLQGPNDALTLQVPAFQYRPQLTQHKKPNNRLHSGEAP
ncbi:MAG: hypothetical protein ACOY5C_07245 [Pseudomonadota bacterium]|uniref:hypothetical protein n=1 Tax=Thermithiobacillus tepidarius TaxID=929 RepID=UPI000427501E|nr:hypothetical protein [Thermithiobacillus tepidarius]